jgi:vacuolar-type H+-ATPase subunit H
MSEANPLIAIRDKERALAQAISAAHARADARVAEARARADAIQSQAERDGMREAEALYQDGIERARAEAGEIQARGEADAAALRAAGRARLEEAVEYIIRFVLPHEANEPMNQPWHRPRTPRPARGR